MPARTAGEDTMRKSILSMLLAALVTRHRGRPAGRRAGRPTADEHTRASQVPLHGARAGRAHCVGLGRARRSEYLLPGFGIGRPVEIVGCRTDVRADLRRSECRRDRIDCRRGLGSKHWSGSGTGEPWVIRYSDVIGDGVYKSTDAGKTWQHMGLVETGRISRVLIHPTNPNIVYVCAQGRLDRTAGRTRRVQVDRRRRQLAACPVCRPQHQLLRSRYRQVRPQHAHRRHVASRAAHLGAVERRARQWRVYHSRRRREVDEGHDGTAEVAASAKSTSRSRSPTRSACTR